MFAPKLKKNMKLKKISVLRRCLKILSDGADTTEDGKLKYVAKA